MKTDDALQMIKLCLDSITDTNVLIDLNSYLLIKLVECTKPKTRKYTKKEETQ